MAHLTAPQLLDYHKNVLSAERTAEVKTHLAECDGCQQELDKMIRMLSGLQQANFVEPSPTATQKLTQAFRQKQARLSSRLQQMASLEFDSWANAAAANVRRQMGQRQMLFSEGAYDIDLQVMNHVRSQSFNIQGQILKAVTPEERDTFTTLAGLQVRLFDENGEEWWGVTDENGRFSFLQLAYGTYTFHLLLEDRDIVFENLDIRA